MARHIQPLDKSQEGKFLLPIISPIPSQILQFMNWLRLRMGNERWSMTIEEHHNLVKSNIETGSLSDCLVLSGDNSCVVM